MDVIFIRDLRLDTRIGAYEFERRQPQTLQFEIEIGRPSIAACETDRLADTIDYAAVVKAIQGVLADHVSICSSRWPRSWPRFSCRASQPPGSGWK